MVAVRCISSTAEAQCERLRSLVQDCIAKHLYASAAFFADKLVTLSQHAAGDVFLLAQTYYVSHQFRRATLLLREHGLMEDIRFRYLAAKCLAEVKEWDEVLLLLGDGSNADEAMAEDEEHRLGVEVRLSSAVWLLRGRAYEAIDNRATAARAYSAALLADPYCYEAFRALVESHMLSNGEELALVDSLPLSKEDRWLQLMYRCKCKKYCQQDTMQAQLEELEAPLTPSSSSPGGVGPDYCQPATAADAAGEEWQGAEQQPGHDKGHGHGQAEHTAADTPAMSGPRGARNSRQRGQHRSSGRGAGGSGSQAGTPVAGKAADMVLDEGLHVASAPAHSLLAAGAPAAEVASSSGQAHPVTGSMRSGGCVAGCGLAGNTDLLACRADWYYSRGAHAECYRLTHALLQRDPYAVECLPVHLASSLQLAKKDELFLRGHKLVQEYPGMALSWFAAGCYYLATHQHDQARRHLTKATQLDRNCAPAWVAVGHACALQDESDQAMAAYRTAARLFPGLHAPALGMGMEYCRMNNLSLAERMFLQAYRMCPDDPAVAHELGTLAYRNRQYASAVSWLQRALELAPSAAGGRRELEATLLNLGHALRKLQHYEEAVEAYERALGVCPTNGATHAALGYTRHLMGETSAAIEHYHRALGLRPDDGFAGEMLREALREGCFRFRTSTPGLHSAQV